MGNRRRYAQALLLLGVVAICAVTARLVGHHALPSVKLDPASISVDGIRLGMTEGEVEAIKGPPTDRKDLEGGAVYLEFGSECVFLSKSVAERIEVDHVFGKVLEVDSRTILKPGDSDRLAQKTLSSLGEPEYFPMRRCAEMWLFGLRTPEIFQSLQGELTYPNGLSISVAAGEYRGVSFARR
jgi:hypothetical protein